MTYPSDQDEFPAVCPYLGLADDADSHATYATEAHRCYRLETPTRIATGHQETYCLGANHVNCPVYKGEGIGGTAPAATAAAAAPAAAPRPREPQRPPARQPAAPARPRSQAALGGNRRPPGTLNPRPRSGGISMPVATIGLFALAIIVIGVAFAIQQAVGGGGDNGLSPADRVATNVALGTSQGRTPTPSNAQTQTAQRSTPSTNTETPGAAATTTGTPPAGGGGTYTVQSGDTCSAIAQANNITLDQFFEANPDIDRSCNNLAVGQVVKLP